MFFSFCLVLLLGLLGPQAPENLGTKVVTRQTVGSGFTEQTFYITADRRRIEFRSENDASPGMQSELSSVFILRCDLGQSFILRPKTEEYSSWPYPPKSAKPEQAAQLAVENSDTAEPAKPTLHIETTTVDTGERKEMFGYVARHVITTRQQTPLDGSNSQPSQSVTDGWYIDIDLSISCDPKPSAIDRPEFVEIGALETGLPLKETRPFQLATKFSDGTRAASALLFKSEVTVLEKAPLDPALFEVPSGYKQVEN